MSPIAALREAALSQKGEGFALAAPVKINLALHVLGKRPDGYHNLESLVAFSNAGDVLHFRAAERDNFTAAGPYAANMGRAGNNLVLRARNALRAVFGTKAFPPAAIHLEKNLPVAAGLGGGSADAAACLAGLCLLNGRDIEQPGLKRDLMRLAAGLGADVPMCLAWFYQKTAFIARGRGELLEPLPYFPALPAVVVNNGTRLATASVFARLAGADNAPLPQDLAAGPPMDFVRCAESLRSTRNDLYAPALQAAPALAEIPALLGGSGAVWCSMSGSGSSFFGLYAAKEEAQAAADFIRQKQPGWFVLALLTDGAPLPQ